MMTNDGISWLAYADSSPTRGNMLGIGILWLLKLQAIEYMFLDTYMYIYIYTGIYGINYMYLFFTNMSHYFG